MLRLHKVCQFIKKIFMLSELVSMYLLFIEFLIIDIFNLTYHIISSNLQRWVPREIWASNSGDTLVTGSTWDSCIVCSSLLLLIQNINTCATIFSGPIKVNYIYIYENHIIYYKSLKWASKKEIVNLCFQSSICWSN